MHRKCVILFHNIIHFDEIETAGGIGTRKFYSPIGVNIWQPINRSNSKVVSIWNNCFTHAALTASLQKNYARSVTWILSAFQHLHLLSPKNLCGKYVFESLTIPSHCYDLASNDCYLFLKLESEESRMMFYDDK